MNRTRLFLVVWITVALLACGALLLDARTHRRAIAQLEPRIRAAEHTASAEAPRFLEEHADVRAQQADAKTRLAAAEALLAIRTAEVPSVPSSPAELIKRLGRNPAYREFQQRRTQRSVYSLFGDLLADSSLSEEKRVRLRSLLFELLDTTRDSRELLAAAGITRADAVMNPTLRRVRSEIDEEIHALLGEALFHDYKYAASYRMMESQLLRYEDHLRAQAVPELSEPQRKAVRAAYRTHTYPRIPGREKNMMLGAGFGPDQYGPPRDKKIQSDLRDVLLPAQFQALVEYQRDDRRQSEIYSEMSERLASSGPGGVKR
jgi:hypothetical protein